MIFLWNRGQSLPKMLMQYIGQKRHIAATDIKRTNCNFQCFYMLIFMRIIFLIVFLGGHRETTYRKIYYLFLKIFTISLGYNIGG